MRRRKLIFVVIGALVILGFIIFVWFWFFGRTSQVPGGSGTFETASERTGSGTSGGAGGNQQTPLAGQSGSQTVSSGSGAINTQVPLPTYTSGTGVSGGGTVSGVAPPVAVYPGTVPGAVWVDGSSVSSGGSTKTFNPTPINQLNNIDISGTGYFGGTGQGGGGGGGLDFGTALAGAGIAGVVACTPGLLSGIAGSSVISGALGFVAVTVNAPVQNAVDSSNTVRDNFLNCITRQIARSIINQITASVVDWINSGFDGKPAFVQNYQQFFTSVADKTAGEFIQGSDLAFLCSPFKLQVRIAIAQSYAHRRSGGAPSCTLSGVVNNVDNFLNNGFSSGGWPGLLAFTTEPTNNPYGAFMYGQAQLGNRIASAQLEAGARISPGGFLSQEKCDTNLVTQGTTIKEEKINCRVVTPGQTIQETLQKSLNVPLESLNLADNFDEIISALLTQLITRTLYGGLANVSGQSGYASNFSQAQDPQASSAAQQLLSKLQGAVALAGQYGTTQQGSIADIQNAQSQLVNLENCWSTAASSTGITATQQETALANAAATSATVQSLEAQVAYYNAQITRANGAIAKVQELQTSALAARTLAEVQAVDTQFTNAQNSSELITQNDVTAALQDRTTLQTQMDAQNQTTAAGLAQCYAFGQ